MSAEPDGHKPVLCGPKRSKRAAAQAERIEREYDDRLAHEAQRAIARDYMYAGIEHISGYDTPAANAFAADVLKLECKNREARRRAKIGGDPLNLTGHTKKPTEKRAKHQAERERLAKGKRKHLLPDPENPRQNIFVDTAAHSFHNLPQANGKQKKDDPGKAARHIAADRFRADFNLANFNGLRSSQFDERVDSSGAGSGMGDVVLQAVDRLNAVKRYVGIRAYEILEVRIGMEVSAEEFHKNGGTDHRSNNADLVVALNMLVAFYGGGQLMDPNWRAARSIKARSRIMSWRSK